MGEAAFPNGFLLGSLIIPVIAISYACSYKFK